MMNLQDQETLLDQLFTTKAFINLIQQDCFITDMSWNAWFAEYAMFASVRMEARAIYVVRFFESQTVSLIPQQEEVWSKLEVYLDNKGSSKLTKKRTLASRWIGYAAAVLLLFGISIWLIQQGTHYSLVKEEYLSAIESQRIDLPDGSRLILERNSKARFEEDENGRKLYLSGQGYLEVAKKENGGKRIPFLVNPGGFEVKVLGTHFYITNTGSRKLVALEEGRTQIENKVDKIEMKPGEVVVEEHGRLKYLDMPAAMMWARKDGVLELNNTPLRQVIDWLKYSQEKQVVVDISERTMKMTTSGNIDLMDEDNLYRSLMGIFDILIIERSDRIEILNN